MEDPFFRRVRENAKRKLHHEPGTDHATMVADYKAFLKQEEEALEKLHRKADGGRKAAQARTAVMDSLLEQLMLYAISPFKEKHPEEQITCCLLALGGYGRAELCPFSDIDIMFLYPDKTKVTEPQELEKMLTDTILYVLWDLGLKVGHSSRSIKQGIEEARKSIETKNALLEARLITGSEKLFYQFQQTYESFYRKDNPQEYIEERLKDQKLRRTKYGDTVFLQEPDIKNGVGGLRDYQNILWMAQIKLGSKVIDDLKHQGYLKPAEFLDFTRSYDFLLRVRTELHLQSKRPNDVLTLDKQPQIAWKLGYAHKDIFKRVEAFMKDYYFAAQSIYRTSKLLEQRLALTARKVSFKAVIEARRYEKKQYIDGFILRGDVLSANTAMIFRQEPERLIRVFRHCQQFRAKMDFELTVLIRDSLSLIDKTVINSPGASKTFRAILSTRGEVHPTLLEMHELGVLEHFLPEWKELTCLVQHEYYHRYTADIHVLNTIAELDRVFAGEEREVEKYKKVIHATDNPDLLYTILLLHDIGKGRGIKGHAETGAVLADKILDRWQVDKLRKEQILFIIRNHLEMARFWQHYDVDDPRTAESFADIVGEPDLLRYLYVHTYCDARGTTTSLWNGYKDSLHTQLFENTLDHLQEGGEQLGIRKKERTVMISKEMMQAYAPEISLDEIEAHYNLLPERYFIHHTTEEIALHLRMVNSLLKKISDADSMGSLIPVINWHNDLSTSMTVVNVVTWDRAGLFYKLAGAFSVAGLNILSSKAISRSDHITIDTFFVTEPGGGIVQNEKAQKLFEQHLNDSLTKNKDLLQDIIAQAKKSQKPVYLRQDDHLRAPIPTTVDVYHELSLRRTILEIQTTDQIGLLYRITRAIYEHGFDITFARISTERGVAVDTFYIENADKARSQDTPDLLALRDHLTRLIAPETDAVVNG